VKTTLSPLLPDLTYDKGFLTADRREPFWDLGGSFKSAHWSDDMTEFNAESSRHHFIDRYNRSLALKALGPALLKEDSCYIDIGCSSGYLLEEAVHAFPRARIFGAEESIDGLRRCHEHLPDIPLFRMDITRAALGNNLFDAMSCLNVLEHLDNDIGALDELRRMLKPSGRLFISVPAGPALYDFNDEVHFHVRRYDRTLLRQAIEKAGLTLLKINYFAAFLYPVFFIRKRINQYLFGKATPEEKRRKALAQASATERSRIAEGLCALEQRMGHVIPFPFGIRLFAIATKE
jgi:SAM-dependent methyltransferase